MSGSSATRARSPKRFRRNTSRSSRRRTRSTSTGSNSFKPASALTSRAVRQIALEDARRLAVLRQGLAGSRFPIDHEGILKLIRGLGCLQLDPTRVVARNPLLVLWSRLGSYDSAIIEDMLWRRKELFEYWAHAASIVLTEDFPLHNLLMRTYPRGDSKFTDKVRWW